MVALEQPAIVRSVRHAQKVPFQIVVVMSMGTQDAYLIGAGEGTKVGLRLPFLARL